MIDRVLEVWVIDWSGAGSVSRSRSRQMLMFYAANDWRWRVHEMLHRGRYIWQVGLTEVTELRLEISPKMFNNECVVWPVLGSFLPFPHNHHLYIHYTHENLFTLQSVNQNQINHFRNPVSTNLHSKQNWTQMHNDIHVESARNTNRLSTKRLNRYMLSTRSILLSSIRFVIYISKWRREEKRKKNRGNVINTHARNRRLRDILRSLHVRHLYVYVVCLPLDPPRLVWQPVGH